MNDLKTEFLERSAWTLLPTGAYQLIYQVNKKFILSVLSWPKTELYEVGLIHIASNDIITVRHSQDLNDIENFISDVNGQSI